MKFLVSCPRGRTFDTFFPYDNIRLAEGLGTVVWNPYARNMSVSEAAELLEGCDVYVTSWGAPPLEQQLLRAAPRLKLLTHLCGNALPMMTAAARRRGVKAISGEKYFFASAAEGTVAAVLAALRGIPEFSYRLKYKKEWKHSWDAGKGIIGKRIGIVHYTPIAAEVVRILSSFNVEFSVYDPSPVPKAAVRRYGIRQISIEDVFKNSDVIIVHTPNSPLRRYHVIDTELLSLIRTGSMLVNTSSSGIISYASLAASLSTGRFHAVLDVFACEPPIWNDPLFLLPNVTLMPHVAGPTSELRSFITRKLLIESAAYIERGEPLKNAVRLPRKPFGGERISNKTDFRF